jgi:peptidoglycan hydrolase-like amidase
MKLGPVLLCFALIGSTASAQSEDVRIGVLGLFHPSELTVSSTPGGAVILHADNQSLTLDTSTGLSRASIRAHEAGLVVRCGRQSLNAHKVTLASREGGPADFMLSVPAKITRRYRGRLEISNVSGELIPVVSMDLETAVASVVAAETIPGDPSEALKAQAVATRSYFVAGKGRHKDFDFCDTTHCQFLRSPPPPQSAAFKAAAATKGLVLAFESRTFAAMYTRSCSGRTRTPVEAGLPPGNYPYYSVECHYCRQHPVRWQSRISAQDASNLRPSNEPSRLEIDRKLGWNTVPSNDFTIKRDDGQVVLEGVGRGHGIGLCQAGAKAMAEHGANFHQILVYYYPNTQLITLPR